MWIKGLLSRSSDYYSRLRIVENGLLSRSSDYYSRLRNADKNGLLGRPSDYYSRLRNVDKMVFLPFFRLLLSFAKCR